MKIKKNIKIANFELPFGVVSFLVLLAVTTVFLAIESGALGAQLMTIEKEERDLIRQNEELKTKLVTSNSLSKISESTEKLGLAKPEQVIYLTGGDERVAWKQD